MIPRRTILLDSAVLFLLASVLIAPLFQLEYLDNWPSIESTFISDARMLAEHLPHPGWQPLWYCGTRFDYIYPPALRYGTALISIVGHVSTARGYHIYTAVLYAFGIVAVYWLVRAGSGARSSAILAAIATALVSPSFLLLKRFRYDSAHLVPQRLHVLMAYGEGPHISALCVLPAALAATFLAVRRGRPAMLAAAGALCAFTVANNFYGATALAIFFPLVVWSVWTGEPYRAVWLRAAAIVGIAYGLSAFWLTPSYIWITIEDLKWVSQPGNPASRIAMIALLAAFCVATWRIGKRRPEREWPVFVAGGTLVFGALVLGIQHGFRVVGEANRLVPELDLVLTLALVEVARACWRRPMLRSGVLVLAVVALSPTRHYLRYAWSPFPSATLANSYEYQTTKWIHDHLPGRSVLPSGTVRFWFDAWFDDDQPDGGSEQGMLNQNIPVATWQILHGDRADLAILWLQALGADAVVVPGRNSREWYHDYQFPRKFQGVVPVLFDDGHDTVIYQVPRVQPVPVRVVEEAKLRAVGPFRGGDDVERLTAYRDIIEKADQPRAAVAWHGFDRAELRAQVEPGQAMLFQQTYDPAWHASENGQELPIRGEASMGFMLIEAAPGAHRIEMHFETPFENRAGHVLFVVTIAGMALLVWRRRSPVK